MSNIMGIRSGAMKTERMAIDTLFAQSTLEAPSALRKETPLLPVCCLCGLIRDEIGASLDSTRWVTQGTYRKTHGVNPAECLTQAMETIRAAQVMEKLTVV
jgi:hypothetical protein